MRGERKGAKDTHDAHLAGVSGFSGADTKNGSCERNLRTAQGNDRTGLCGREGKTRDALYTPPRPGRCHTMGQA